MDIDFTTRVLTDRRVAVELVPRFHPEGGRFLVKQYPKDREHRRLKLSAEIISKIKEHVSARGVTFSCKMSTSASSRRVCSISRRISSGLLGIAVRPAGP